MSDLSKVKTKLTEISPEQAKSYLDFTAQQIEAGAFRQRPISDNTVDRYVRDIRLGMWAASPQCVSIDTVGNVIDGRHRLEAIVRAGVPVTVNLSTGWPGKQKCGKLELNTIDVIDRGRGRSIASQINIGHGILNACYQAAVAKTIAEICCDQRHVTLSVAQTLLILELYHDAAEAIHKLSGLRKRVSFICGPLSFHYVADPETTEAFATKFFGMEGLHSGHPALALIKWIENHPRSGSQDRSDTSKVILSSIQAFTSNQKLSKVYVSQGAWLWATGMQKDNVRKVRQIIGIK